VLDSVHLFGGSNGWTGQHEKADARRKLSGLVGRGAVDADTAAAYMHARGVHGRGVKQIREIVTGLAQF